MNYKIIINKDADEEIVATVHAPSYLTEQIENLIRNYSGTDSLTGQSDDGITKLPFERIECVTVIERKVIAIDTLGKHYRLQGTLRDLEATLPSYFIRINKSAIANEHSISRFDTVFSGGVDAVFKCGHRDYVSRRCFSQIKRRYGI